MKLEDQVCSLELAKNLKELGVPQESAFYWGLISSDNGGNGNYGLWLGGSHEYEMCSFTWAAFTVAELGKRLPATGLDAIKKDDDGAWSTYRTDWNRLGDLQLKEADARAQMLIYFFEEKLMPSPAKGEERKE